MKIQFIPINQKKIPTVPKWNEFEGEHNFNGAYGRGIVCGKLSGNIEAIDIDLKYDITGNLYERYKRLIKDNAPDLLQKLTVQKTVSNGYHFIYRCSLIERNKKLANRPTTEAERKQAYDKEFEASKDPVKAQGASDNDKVRVLLETRGEGGYIAAVPTPGYALIYGTFETIQEITPDEREILISCARTFNEVIAEFKPPTPLVERKQVKGLSTFEDYNTRADVVGLLQSHGWKVIRQQGSKVLFLRPGQTTSQTSGNWDKDKNWFSVFSTSTAFENEKAYNPCAVYAVLECKGDFKEASKRLYEAGYGERRETGIKVNEPTVKSRINLADNDLSFVAGPADYEAYLHAWRTGTFEMGLTTGINSLDKYFLFKRNSLVIINGIDNVGKSTVIWYLALLSNLLHGWKWIIFSAENSEGSVMRKLIEFYWSEGIKYMNETKYKIAKEHIEKNFKIIKSDDELYNHKDVLNMAKKINQNGEYSGLLIDPYNALKIEIQGRGFGVHEYHYEAVSEMKLFTKTNKICVYVNTHVVTAATRTAHGEQSIPAPKRADTEQGAKFANKADDFLTIHRDTSHPEDWRWSQIFVRKIKESETGGSISPWDQPVRLTMSSANAGFIEAGDDQRNPVKEYHKFNHPYQDRMNDMDLEIEAKVEVSPADQKPALAENNDFLSQSSAPIHIDDGTEPPF